MSLTSFLLADAVNKGGPGSGPQGGSKRTKEFFHGTPAKNVSSIIQNGIRPSSYSKFTHATPNKTDALGYGASLANGGDTALVVLRDPTQWSASEKEGAGKDIAGVLLTPHVIPPKNIDRIEYYHKDQKVPFKIHTLKKRIQS